MTLPTDDCTFEFEQQRNHPMESLHQNPTTTANGPRLPKNTSAAAAPNAVTPTSCSPLPLSFMAPTSPTLFPVPPLAHIVVPHRQRTYSSPARFMTTCDGAQHNTSASPSTSSQRDVEAGTNAMDDADVRGEEQGLDEAAGDEETYSSLEIGGLSSSSSSSSASYSMMEDGHPPQGGGDDDDDDGLSLPSLPLWSLWPTPTHNNNNTDLSPPRRRRADDEEQDNRIQSSTLNHPIPQDDIQGVTSPSLRRSGNRRISPTCRYLRGMLLVVCYGMLVLQHHSGTAVPQQQQSQELPVQRRNVELPRFTLRRPNYNNNNNKANLPLSNPIPQDNIHESNKARPRLAHAHSYYSFREQQQPQQQQQEPLLLYAGPHHSKGWFWWNDDPTPQTKWNTTTHWCTTLTWLTILVLVMDTTWREVHHAMCGGGGGGTHYTNNNHGYHRHSGARHSSHPWVQVVWPMTTTTPHAHRHHHRRRRRGGGDSRRRLDS